MNDQTAEAQRLETAAQQLHIMTGGRSDRTRCYVLLAEFWSSEADMCPEPATHRVEYDDYRTGLLTEGVFYPASTTSRVCAAHEKQARRMPGWRWSAVIES